MQSLSCKELWKTRYFSAWFVVLYDVSLNGKEVTIKFHRSSSCLSRCICVCVYSDSLCVFHLVLRVFVSLSASAHLWIFGRCLSIVGIHRQWLCKHSLALAVAKFYSKVVDPEHEDTRENELSLLVHSRQSRQLSEERAGFCFYLKKGADQLGAMNKLSRLILLCIAWKWVQLALTQCCLDTLSWFPCFYLVFVCNCVIEWFCPWISPQ